MVPITIDSVCRTCGTQVRLAEHLATQRQTAAGYDTFFSLVEKALLSPDLDRFRRDYLQVRSNRSRSAAGARAVGLESYDQCRGRTNPNPNPTLTHVLCVLASSALGRGSPDSEG